MPNAAAFLRSLKAEISFAKSLDWETPPPPEGPAAFENALLKPAARTTIRPLQPAQDLETIRFELQTLAHEFAMDKDASGLLLLGVPAGVGKTHGVVGVAQAVGRAGGRVLWAAQDHAAWQDMLKLKNFQGAQWLHWHGLGQVVESVPLCEHYHWMHTWINRGYPARELCGSLCKRNGHMEVCPYHIQSQSNAPCVFGMHAHLIYGMPLTGFTLAVVDELPMNAFIRERVVPWRTGIMRLLERLDGDGVKGGPTHALLQALINALYRADPQLAGRALFDIIGPIVEDAQAALDTGYFDAPKIPAVVSPKDVMKADYFFIHDFLRCAALGFEAWRHGWDRWATRVWISRQGLHLLSRHALWDELPRKTIALDATAEKRVYQTLFRHLRERDDGGVEWVKRKVRQVYAPRAERLGRIVQITGRLYSKKSLYKKIPRVHMSKEDGTVIDYFEITPLPKFYELVGAIAELARIEGVKKIGVITYLDLEEEFAAALTDLGFQVITRHFYKVRGTNSMMGCGALFVVGTPTPGAESIIKTATALDPERRMPFIMQDIEGERVPNYKSEPLEFALTPAALQDVITRHKWPADTQGVTKLIGVYKDDYLRQVHDQVRGAELLQAAHRGRVNMQNITVYVFTATPLLAEPLDAIYNHPPLCPPEINWRKWPSVAAYLAALPAGTILGNEELGANVAYSVRTVADGGWIKGIVNFSPEWEKYCDPEKKRGGQKIKMRKLENSPL